MNPDERRKNVDTTKGLIDSHLVEGTPISYAEGHSSTDIDAVIRRSEIELPHYELKQGLLRLDDSRAIDPDIIAKVIRTISAIANNGKDRAGTILIGVTNKDGDARRVEQLDGIRPRKVSRRYVVGARREANHSESPLRHISADGRTPSGILN